MNGEIKSYNINSPMRWAEFKRMPDDLKIMYIKWLREKFDVHDRMISDMFGCCQQVGSREITRLGLGRGRDAGKRTHPDVEGWNKWLHGIKEPQKKPEQPEIVPSEPFEIPEACLEELKQTPVLPDVPLIFLPIVPQSGSVTFCGNAIDALGTIERLLNGANVHLNVSWEIIPEDGKGVVSDDAM